MTDARSGSQPLLPPGFDAETSNRLSAYLKAQGLGDGTLRLQRLNAGRSTATFRLAYGAHRMVLRAARRLPGIDNTDFIDREYRALAALGRTVVPVPETRHRCDDLDVLGVPFLLMDHVDGRVFIDASLPGLTPQARAPLYKQVARAMAALHDVDPDAVGLSDFGHRGGYFAPQTALWTQRYLQSAVQPVPEMMALADWLPGNVPDDGRTRIVHGDFHIDHFIFHPTEPRVLAIIDWERATLGHPYADLANQVMAWHVGADLWRGMADKDLPGLGIPDAQGFIADYLHYRQADPITHWDAYLAYSFFRTAARIQYQWAAQQTEHPDAAAADRVAARVASLAALGWHHAQRAQRAPLFPSTKQ